MALLTTGDLLRAFKDRVDASDSIEVAVAWIGPSRALDALLRRAGGQARVRIVVGLYGNATSPIALRSLQETTAEIRIGRCPTGIFHPKFYLFRASDRNLCWIGSANLTLGGFADNSELVHEFTDDGTALRWFEDVWESLNADSAAAIDLYSKNWARPSPIPPVVVEFDNLPQAELGELLANAASWDQYVAALRSCDAYWRSETAHNPGSSFSVLGDEWSWLDTIAHGSAIARRENWDDLTQIEKRILFGIWTNDSTGAWGLLGGMNGAGRARGAFDSQADVRRHIRNALQPLMDANGEEDFLRASIQTISSITELPGFGPAIATRLIALARPDRGVSVNAGSAPSLSQLAGLPEGPTSLANAQNYPRLLQWIYEQHWYNVSEPKDALEQTIWSMRAALIDSFAYRPV